MELEGVMQNGVIVPDDAAALPEGTRVRIEPSQAKSPAEPAAAEPLKTFGEYFAALCGAVSGPPDLAAQHDHYRLGTPKR